MLYLYFVYLLLLLGLLVAGVVERRRHERNVRAIRVRVLVNGIRGKSSVTRLVAGALRGGGLRCVAKTTGSAARFIYPDGSEVPIYRKFGIANVIEQVGIVRRAAAEEPDALVMECMAITPALQEINQTRLVQATMGVVTNVREDHLDQMGTNLTEVARSLSRSMPVGGICVTAERGRLNVLREEASRRHCRLLVVSEDDVTDEELEGFTHHAFKENVAIALRVAEELGVPRDLALEGMWSVAPDPGVLRVDSYSIGHVIIRFANIFNANDPRSTLMDFRDLLRRGEIEAPVYTLINCRPDRVDRNHQMGRLVPYLHAEKVFLIGHPTRSARAAVPQDWAGEVIDLGGLSRTADEIFRSIVAAMPMGGSLVAIGNVHGQGEMLIEHMEGLGDLR